jgi:hypothetical protein
MKISYSLRFPTQNAAERAAAALVAEGYEVTWGIDAEAASESRAEVERARARMQALADELVGEFLGSGSLRLLPPE